MDNMQGGLSLLPQDEQKFTIIKTDCAVSQKVNTKTQRPCQSYIEIEFKKDSEIPFFSYLIFQNFYSHQVTIK